MLIRKEAERFNNISVVVNLLVPEAIPMKLTQQTTLWLRDISVYNVVRCRRTCLRIQCCERRRLAAS